jgi:hypothetical protein
MDTKKLIKIGVIALIFAVVAWQMMGMFGGGSAEINVAPQTRANPEIPKQATITSPKPPQAAMTEREMQLMAMQNELQVKYIAALNELQMLKVQRDIAEANKDIMKAKQDTIVAQTKVVELLSIANPRSLGSLGGPPSTPQNQAQSAPLQPLPQAPALGDLYTVVSVTNLQGRWTAVMNGKKLYNVSVGDILADDGSTVIAIDRSGVTLENGGKRKKLSMVSVI